MLDCGFECVKIKYIGMEKIGTALEHRRNTRLLAYTSHPYLTSVQCHSGTLELARHSGTGVSGLSVEITLTIIFMSNTNKYIFFLHFKHTLNG